MVIVCSSDSSWAQDPYGGFIARSDPRTPAEEQKCFHLPPGFGGGAQLRRSDKEVPQRTLPRRRALGGRFRQCPYPIFHESVRAVLAAMS